MRTGKELIAASKAFTGEDRRRSWFETLITLLLGIIFLGTTFLESIPIFMRIFSSITCGLLYVRLFVIYHDYQHRAILQNSTLATLLMKSIGI